MTPTEIVDCTSLTHGSVIDVETRSRHYRIECLGDNQVKISGHPELCPEPVPARLEGSLDQQGVLEHGVIGCGMRLRFLLKDCQPVTTTRVVHVRVDSPTSVDSSTAVH
jgi:hypothetical protein